MHVRTANIEAEAADLGNRKVFWFSSLRLTASRLDEDDPERQTLIEQALDRYAACVR